MKAQRLRVTFGRGDVLRYITHLDLMRSWERALKRAGLPLAYSEGFTRHPQIALAAPLPVGATAEGELMDIFLAEPLAPAEFRTRLAVQTPPGLTIEAVEEVPLAWPSLNRSCGNGPGARSSPRRVTGLQHAVPCGSSSPATPFPGSRSARRK